MIAIRPMKVDQGEALAGGMLIVENGHGWPRLVLAYPGADRWYGWRMEPGELRELAAWLQDQADALERPPL